MIITAERIADLLEEAPIGAVARLTLLSSAARQDAARIVAEHLIKGIMEEDIDQLKLPLAHPR